MSENLSQPIPLAVSRSRRRLSLTRVFAALVLVGALVAGSWWAINRDVTEAAAFSGSDAWSAPYVDVTITPFHSFEDPGGEVTEVVLAFIVADRDEACTAAWGSVFNLDEAAEELDMDRRLVRLRQTGKDAIVSFGGAINDELAVACTELDLLVDAYTSVVERYDITTIDLDIEGDALQDLEAHTRRGAALARVQETRRAEGNELAIWLTLPVSPSGLPQGAVAALDALLEAGVDVAGVNAMTMNFGASRGSSSMIDASRQSLEAMMQQLLIAWRRAGTVIGPAEAWSRIGATPMIGRNDVAGDNFTLGDAEDLVEFVTERGLGRLSYWSLNRDRPCAPNEAVIQGPSNTCTHLDQDPLDFALIFSAVSGRAREAAGEELAFAQPVLIGDDPDRSPYPIWSPDQAFQATEKVVWHGYVYDAKWWTQGDDPEALVVNVWDTPWHIIGPVLESDLVDPVLFPPSVAPAWDGESVYSEGDRVWLAGKVYEAKWWNQGFQPNRKVDNDWDTPWQLSEP